ncbi:hypothetical protein NHX12_024775, partial [Muraenolepis orangiensis]
MALLQPLPFSTEQRIRRPSGPGAPRLSLENTGSVGGPRPAPYPAPRSRTTRGGPDSPTDPVLLPSDETHPHLKEGRAAWATGPGTPPGLPHRVEVGAGCSGAGPPPKLVPVSGKLEMNMENAVLRPTAFKPVVPRSRSSGRYLSPSHGPTGQSGSRNNLNSLSPAHADAPPSCWDERSSYCGRGQGAGRSCSASDSGRTSLSSPPPYPGSSEGRPGPALHAHGHCASDSGRSSSGKSTGSSGRSPAPLEGYEDPVRDRAVRDLEDKLREREQELRLLRDNLDENEAAVCQVYEEKQKRCELEVEELRQGCATRMQTASHKSQRNQQVLQLQ